MKMLSSVNSDIVIIGGGVHGASLAYAFACAKVGKVMLIEKGHLASGPTAQSGAMIRPSFLTSAYIQLVLEATRTFENWGDEVGGDCGFVQNGFLRITRSLEPEELGGDLDLMRRLQVPFEILESADLRHYAPQAEFDENDQAVLFPSGGYADPVLTTASLGRAAEREGATILTDTSVRDIRCVDGRIEAVETDHDTIHTRLVVNCAGAWARRVAAMVGVDLPIQAHRQPTCLYRNPQSHTPELPCFSDGVNRIYYRSVGDSMIRAGTFGVMEDPVDTADDFDETIDIGQLRKMGSALHQRGDKLRRATFFGGFSALYDMTPDGHPIISQFPEVEGFWCNCGWSGNGFAGAPAVGRRLRG